MYRGLILLYFIRIYYGINPRNTYDTFKLVSEAINTKKTKKQENKPCKGTELF